MNSFGWALTQMLTSGNPKVRRAGWPAAQSIQVQDPDDLSKMTQQYIFQNQFGGEAVPWTPQNVDLLTSDWTSA